MIGPNIKKLRERKRITQQQLAKVVGVTRQAICMWETGKREPPIAMLNEMARIFRVSLDDIMKVKGYYAITKRKEADMVRKGQKKVDFEFIAPNAKKVMLTGDFNSWSNPGITLKKEKNGLWKTEVALKPGRYEYKFIVDGQWYTDPTNKSSVRNAYGTENSMKEVKV